MVDEYKLDHRESIKLIKGAKNYQWEIKIFTQGEGIILDSLDIKRLKELNEMLKKDYEGEGNADDNK